MEYEGCVKPGTVHCCLQPVDDDLDLKDLHMKFLQGQDIQYLVSVVLGCDNSNVLANLSGIAGGEVLHCKPVCTIKVYFVSQSVVTQLEMIPQIWQVSGIIFPIRKYYLKGITLKHFCKRSVVFLLLRDAQVC